MPGTITYLAIMEGDGELDYYRVYGDIFNFHKKYSLVRDSPEYWEQLDKEAHEILDQYNHAKFVADLVVAVIIELERVAGKEKYR